MKVRLAERTGWVALWAALAFPLCGQTAGGGSAAACAPAATEGPAQRASVQPGEVFREIDEPSTGNRWLLMRDARHPGGPGRMVLADGPRMEPRHETAGGGRQKETSAAHAARPRPVIRAGDALIVEEHTAVVDARLEAVALGPAAGGAELKARLKIGGKVVRVVALGPGRAALAPESEAQP